jgi:hypothetical protein
LIIMENHVFCNSDNVLLLRHPSLDNEQLLLGDVVISVETAARQAEERGHGLVDELRILLVNFSHLYPLFSVFYVKPYLPRHQVTCHNLEEFLFSRTVHI